MQIIISYEQSDQEGYVIDVPGDTNNFPQAPAPGEDYHYRGRDIKRLQAIARRAYQYHTGEKPPKGVEIVVNPRP